MSFDNNIDFKDHIVQYPNRFKQTTVAPGIVELVPTWIETPSQIIQPGTPVDSELFKKLKQNVTIYQQTFTTTENQTVISLDRNFLVGQNRVSLSIGGVRQYAGQDYAETDSHTLTMTTPQKGGLKAEVIMFTASQAIAEDFFEQTVAAIAATQAANNAAQAANDAKESAYTVHKAPVTSFADLATTYPSAQTGWEVQTLDNGRVYRRENNTWVYIKELTPAPIGFLTQELDETKEKIKTIERFNLRPSFVEFFASFNKFGLGTPSGITNYTGGKYVVTISGNAGDSFVTVTNGTITDGGGTWACVIQNDDLSTELNRVTGISGSTFILLRPLKKNINVGKLGNLHDAVNGQHYTELGYYAFAQHFYKATPRYTERQKVIAQFLGTDVSAQWVVVGFASYNLASNIANTDNTLKQAASRNLGLYATDSTKYAEWTVQLSEQKGYVETFIGCDVGQATIEFYLDDLLVGTKTTNKEVERIVFPYEYSKVGKLKIKAAGPTFPQNIYVGNTTWFTSEKFSLNRLIQPSDKVVYMGDSWGEFHNKATTRELARLMQADGGTPTVLNYSKGGHSSDYAREWFEEYVLANKPDVVIIEYFTNDFNSIGGINLGTFTNPSGQQQDMNIASMSEYVANIRFMIDLAIENGIRPVVILPASTNSISQTQAFADKGATLYQGTKITNDKPYFAEASTSKLITDLIESLSSAVGKPIVIKSKETNSSQRVGVVSDSSTALTAANIHTFMNNGGEKASVKHDGGFKGLLFQFDRLANSPVLNEGNYGKLFLLNNASTSNTDQLMMIVKDAAGTLMYKKISWT